MTKAVVAWADRNSANLGVRALAAGTAALIDEPEEEIAFENFGADTAGYLSKTDFVRSKLGLSPRLAKLWSEKDLLLDTCGGDSFTDIYGLPRLRRIELVHQAARAAGMRVVLGPQTIGPFNSRAGRSIAARVMRAADLVLTRDTASAEVVAQMSSSTSSANATDVVFGLPIPSSRLRQRDVILNVSGLLAAPNRHVDSRSYRAAVVATVRALREQGREVALLAHVLDNASSDNDETALRALEAEIGASVETIVPSDLQDVRQVVSDARVVVGARMHACLNALSCGTPAYPWAYSRKFLPLLRDIGWNYGLDFRTDEDVVSRTIAFVDRASSLRDEARRVSETARSRLRIARSEIRRVAGE